MPSSVVALVLVAAICHAVWNAILKSQHDQFAGMFAQLAAAGMLAAAGAAWYGPPPREAWIWLAAGAAPRLCYYFFLAATYRRGDISVLYPMLRGAAPPLAAAGGFLLLHETPPLLAACGIGIVSAGIFVMARTRGANAGAIGFALATALCIASYSLADAKGARVSGDSVQYVFWAMLLDSACFMPLMLLGGRRRLRALSPRKWAAGAVGGALSVAAYGLVLYAYTVAHVGMVAALRETSVVFGVLVGMFFLGEKKSAARITGAIVIAAGAALIAVS
ncbi:MAG: EamA family transporter [Gammaproteobacteria bacterium]